MAQSKAPWTFVNDEDDNIYVFRNNCRLQFKGITFPRVLDVEIASEETLKRSAMDIPTSDAVLIIFADKRKVVLRVSQFVPDQDNFTRSFRSDGSSSCFVETFYRVTSSTNSEIDGSQDLLTQEPVTSTAKSRTTYTIKSQQIPPLMSPESQVEENHDLGDGNGFPPENKAIDGTFEVNLCNISDAPDLIRFRNIDDAFVEQIMDDIKVGTSTQPLALLLESGQELDVRNINNNTFFCLGGNHLRHAYSKLGISKASAKLYVDLTEEECLIVSKMHNDVGHFIKKMTNLDLILLLRRQLSPSNEERVSDIIKIKEWRSRIGRILPKEMNIKSIQPLMNIAMSPQTLFNNVIKVYELYRAQCLKNQKQKKKPEEMKSTSLWKAMLTISDEVIEGLLRRVVDKELSLKEMQGKCEEIKKYRVLQKMIIKATNKAWAEAVKIYFNGNDEDAETALHPYLGMAETPEFQAFIDKLQLRDENVGTGNKSRIYAVREVQAANCVYLGEDEVNEDIMRKVHSKNIAHSIPRYTIMSFSPLEDATQRVGEFSYTKLAVSIDQKKKTDCQFNELKVLHIAQYGTKFVTTQPGTVATQHFVMKDNNMLPIFQLFCHENSVVLIMNSKLVDVIQSFTLIKCSIYVCFTNAQEKRNLKRKFHSVGEE